MKRAFSRAYDQFLMHPVKTILVTGGAGFVGGHVVDTLLSRGHRVVCWDLFSYAGSMSHLAPAMAVYPSSRIENVWTSDMLAATEWRLLVMRGDINDTAMLAALLTDCDGVIALAAETHVDYSYHAPTTFVQANINGTQSVLEALRLANPGLRLLYVSTDEVYGQQLEGTSKEDAPFSPRNVYAATKACGDLLVRTYAEVFGLNAVTVRPCNMFGPRQQPKDLIPKTFAYLMRGQSMTIHGDGRHLREYLDVRDAARMMVHLFENGRRGDAYNLSSGVFRSTRQVVSTVANRLGLRGRDVMTFVDDRPNPDRRYAGDNSKVRASLGSEWRLTSFAKTIAAMHADFQSRRPSLLL